MKIEATIVDPNDPDYKNIVTAFVPDQLYNDYAYGLEGFDEEHWRKYVDCGDKMCGFIEQQNDLPKDWCLEGDIRKYEG